MITFGEEYQSIEGRYESRHAASAVIMESAVLVEKSLINLFRYLFFNLSKKEYQADYIEFGEQLRKKYPHFPNQMMLGHCIGVYRDLGKKFPTTILPQDGILENLNTLNSLRIKVAHPERGKITEADAATALKQASEFFKASGLWDHEIEPIGFTLEKYLSYRKAKEKFQHPDDEKDYRHIIQTAARLLPNLLYAIITNKFSELNYQQKKTVLESSADIHSGEDSPKTLDIYISQFRAIDLYNLLTNGSDLDRELTYIGSNEHKPFSRLTAASYVQALDICFKNLISDETEKYLEYANWVREFCMSKRRIRRQDRHKLAGIATQLDIPPQTASKIQKSVQKILTDQGHQTSFTDDEAPPDEIRTVSEPATRPGKKKIPILVMSAVALFFAVSILFVYWMMTETYAANQLLGTILNTFQLKSEPEVWKDTTTGMEFIYLEGSCFEMGCQTASSEECPPFSEPSHTVCLDDFWISKYETTQGQWEAVMGSNPAAFGGCGNDCPIEMVSWDDVHEFIKNLNDKTDEEFRLPTEAEWEFACRSGGKNLRFSGTEASPAYSAWFSFNSGGSTHPVGKKSPNKLGIYDMSGNVWEWCADGFMETAYQNLPEKNPILGQGATRVIRGGAWDYSATELACSFRADRPPQRRTRNIGFRLVKQP